MVAELDLFVLYRWLLALICMVYAAVVMWRSLSHWVGYFQESRQSAVLGRYTIVLLLRTRWRRFVSELLQIAALLAALAVLLYAHYGFRG
jgi:hypothetical protein